MSGYLGSIGFAFPAAMGAWAATRGSGRKVVSVSGDGGFGQYLAELTTAVRYTMPITHVLLNNSELGKISKEQIGALRPVWQTQLVNPDFAEYARLCGARGWRVEDPGDVYAALAEAMAVTDGPDARRDRHVGSRRVAARGNASATSRDLPTPASPVTGTMPLRRSRRLRRGRGAAWSRPTKSSDLTRHPHHWCRHHAVNDETIQETRPRCAA